jgi:hypothetical protein
MNPQSSFKRFSESNFTRALLKMTGTRRPSNSRCGKGSSKAIERFRNSDRPLPEGVTAEGIYLQLEESTGLTKELTTKMNRLSSATNTPPSTQHFPTSRTSHLWLAPLDKKVDEVKCNLKTDPKKHLCRKRLVN